MHIHYSIIKLYCGPDNQHGEAGYYWRVSRREGFGRQETLGSEISTFEAALAYVKEGEPGDAIVVDIRNYEEN